MKKTKTMGTLFLKTKTVHWFVFPTTCHCCRMNTEVVSVLWELENISLIKRSTKNSTEGFSLLLTGLGNSLVKPRCTYRLTTGLWCVSSVTLKLKSLPGTFTKLLNLQRRHRIGQLKYYSMTLDIPCGFSSKIFIKIKLFSSKKNYNAWSDKKVPNGRLR